MQKIKKTKKVSEKFISEQTILDSRNKYFGMFILVNTSALSISAPIPCPTESEKKEKTILPAKRYIVKCSIWFPKNDVKTILIISSVRSGDSTLHSMPRYVLLYFFLKSRFTSSRKRKPCFHTSRGERHALRETALFIIPPKPKMANFTFLFLPKKPQYIQKSRKNVFLKKNEKNY
jgi:hypothetical protein